MIYPIHCEPKTIGVVKKNVFERAIYHCSNIVFLSYQEKMFPKRSPAFRPCDSLNEGLQLHLQFRVEAELLVCFGIVLVLKFYQQTIF